MSLFINFFTFKKTIAVVLSSLVMLCNLPAENLISEYRMKLKQLELNHDDVNSFDRLIMNPYSKTLDYAGTGFTALMLFTPSVMFAAPKEDYWKIGLEYAETIALAYGVKELIKMNVSRARPYMYFNGAPVDKFEDDDWDDSFISGHTTLSFAAASFTTFMYCQYFPDSRFKSLVIAGSYSLAATTAGLRIASGNHFMTDVLCGAAVGTGIGFLVPLVNSLWFKPSSEKKNSGFEMNVSPTALMFKYNF